MDTEKLLSPKNQATADDGITNQMTTNLSGYIFSDNSVYSMQKTQYNFKEENTK